MLIYLVTADMYALTFVHLLHLALVIWDTNANQLFYTAKTETHLACTKVKSRSVTSISECAMVCAEDQRCFLFQFWPDMGAPHDCDFCLSCEYHVNPMYIPSDTFMLQDLSGIFRDGKIHPHQHSRN